MPYSCKIAWSAALTALALQLLGCGGGSPSPVSTGPAHISMGDAKIGFTGPAPKAVTTSSGALTVVGATGSNLTSVTFQPSPSLANTSILYTLQDGTGNHELWSISPDGSSNTLVFSSPDQIRGAGYTADGHIVLSLPDFATGYYQVFECNYDGSHLNRITSNNRDHFNVAWSPNNKFVAYDDGQHVSYLNVATGAEIPLAASSAVSPAWSPDSTFLAYVVPHAGNFFGGTGTIWTASATDSTPVQISLASETSAHNPIWMRSSNGRGLIAYGTYDTTPFNSRIADPTKLSPTFTYEIPANTVAYQVNAVSPDGKYVVVSNLVSNQPELLQVASTYGQNPTTIASSSNGVFAWGWSPYLTSRSFVGGTSPVIAYTASGFLWSQVSDKLAAMVSFTAKTASKAAVIPESNGPGAIVYDLRADTITSMGYVNGYYLPPITSSPGVSDVLVSFSATTGQVTTVAPFVVTGHSAAAKHVGNQLVFDRQFTGVWDAKGKNLAPNGTSHLSLDATTGEPSTH